jgi:hypothetical protein
LASQYQEDKGFGVLLVGLRKGVAGDFQTHLRALSSLSPE